MPPKVALIVGVGRGIGLSIAQRLAEDGMDVFLGDKDESLLSQAIETLEFKGCTARPVIGDLTVPSGAASMVDTVVEIGGSIDIVVNSARAGKRRGMLDEDDKNWDLTQAVMLKAPYFTSQRAIHHMIKQGTGGVIVNIGSVAGHMVTPSLSPAYHAAKAALHQVTRYLATMAGPHGIRVNTVSAGFIVKDDHLEKFMAEDNHDYRQKAIDAHPLCRIGYSKDIADAVSFLCSPASAFVTGTEMCVDGGLTLQEQWSLLDPTA